MKLKFKAYSSLYKKFFDVTHIDFVGKDLEGYVTFEDNKGDVLDAKFDGKEYTLIQFTGYYDIFKQELYGGDLIEIVTREHNRTAVLEHNKDGFYVERHNLSTFLEHNRVKRLKNMLG